ncbi:MAG TPA: hypothetical protein VFW94_15140, partial [Candidatus Acidoferrales bacterium]|nr:hypothetical protein [Candidatus Acidoferrales bacterium]
YGMLVPLTVAFIRESMRWYRIVSLDRPIDRLDQPRRRLEIALRDTTEQGNVIRATWGWIHFAFYAGFLRLFIGTTIIFFQRRDHRGGRIFRVPLLLGGMVEVL